MKQSNTRTRHAETKQFYDCMRCNYSKISSTPQQSKLAQRLHTKVCKQTGRTEDGVKVTDVCREPEISGKHKTGHCVG